jgi:hypothetical protein
MNSDWQRLDWDEFKSQVDLRSLSVQEIKLMNDDDPPTVRTYQLRAVDGEFKIECFVHADGDMSTELTDYENNYQADANKKLNPKDSDGSTLTRSKIAPTGWTYQLHSMEFESCVKNSIYSKDVSNADTNFGTIKFYDAGDVELTEQADIENASTGAVKTVIDWMPTYDYEVIGGVFKQLVLPASDIRMWVIGVPDISDKDFVFGVNLKFVSVNDGIKADGRAPKRLNYNSPPGYDTNKMRVVLRHDAGFKHKMAMIFEIFKA